MKEETKLETAPQAEIRENGGKFHIYTGSGFYHCTCVTRADAERVLSERFPAKQISTPNGFDSRWIEAINAALSGRETPIRITDITGDLWDTFLGPMIDALEDRDATFAEYESEAAQ